MPSIPSSLSYSVPIQQHGPIRFGFWFANRKGQNSDAYVGSTAAMYDDTEDDHAGWRETVAAIATQVNELPVSEREKRVGEVGPAGGNSTRQFSTQIQRAHITAVELDPQYAKHLQQQFQQSDNVTALCEDALDHFSAEDSRYDAILAMFSFTQLPPAKRAEFFQRVHPQLVASEGVFIMGDEFIPEYDATIPYSKEKALWRHHGNVILQALLDDNVPLANLELEALWSGLHDVADFKPTCSDFEAQLTDANYAFEKTKIYPVTTHVVPAQEDSGLVLQGPIPEDWKNTRLWDYYSSKLMQGLLAAKPPRLWKFLPQPGYFYKQKVEAAKQVVSEFHRVITQQNGLQHQSGYQDRLRSVGLDLVPDERGDVGGIYVYKAIPVVH